MGLTLPEYAWARALILLPLSVGIATLSWRFVEQPLTRWARRREAGPAAATASPA
jgi:peptidoglycan/LPS O-acetylase OafA/YrhL